MVHIWPWSPLSATSVPESHDECPVQYSELHCLGEWRDTTLFHLTLCCCTRPTLTSHIFFFLDLLVQDKTDTYKLTAITSLFHKNAPCHCLDYVSNNFNRKSGSITWKAKRILKLCEHISFTSQLQSLQSCLFFKGMMLPNWISPQERLDSKPGELSPALVIVITMPRQTWRWEGIKQVSDVFKHQIWQYEPNKKGKKSKGEENALETKEMWKC